MTIDRRRLIGGAAALAGTAIATPLAAKVKPFTPYFGPRSRAVYVNDLAGDIDGLFATADSDDGAHLFRSDRAHHSELMPPRVSQIVGLVCH